MEFWLTFNSGAEKLQLPVNPAELKLGRGSQNSTISVAGLGEATIIQSPALQTYEFASFFPTTWAPYCAYRDIPNPKAAVAQIERWRASARPMRLIITGVINIAVTCEDFITELHAGDDGITYDISLTEYRFLQPRKIGDSASRPDSSTPPGTYTVRSGDSLWLIAQKHLGNGSRYTEIAKLNNIKPPYTIHPAQVLKLPKE